MSARAGLDPRAAVAGATAGVLRARARCACRAAASCASLSRTADMRNYRRAPPLESSAARPETTEWKPQPCQHACTRGRAPLSPAFLRLRSDEHSWRCSGRAPTTRSARSTTATASPAGVRPPDAAWRARRSRGRAAGRVPAGLPRTARERPPGGAAGVALPVAHNRCIDELRRPDPLPAELAADAEPAFGAAARRNEPPAVAERSAALARLIADVQTLPSQQRSALLMRELQGLTYAELATALGVSVPAVKSLLLRARTGLSTPPPRARRRAPRSATSCCTRRIAAFGSAAGRGGTARIAPAARSTGRAAPRSRGLPRSSQEDRSHISACCSGSAAEAGAARRGLARQPEGAPPAPSVTAAKLAVVVCCAALLGTAGRAVLAPSPSHRPPAAATPTAHAASVPAAASALTAGAHDAQASRVPTTCELEAAAR